MYVQPLDLYIIVQIWGGKRVEAERVRVTHKLKELVAN